MSLLRPTIRCRADRQLCLAYRTQQRYFSRSKPVASPAPGAADAEVQAARKYCVELLAYVFMVPCYAVGYG